MAPKIEKITNENFALGEAPHWDPSTQTLYFVDCFGHYLVRYNPATKKVTKASTAHKHISFIIPVEGKKNQFVISLDRELTIVNWDGESDKFSVVEKLCAVDDVPAKAPYTFNDAKCDSVGRLWAGTMSFNTEDENKTLPVGILYSLDSKRQQRSHVDQLRLSNGLAFNDKEKKMFHIDSLKRTVDQFDFDLANGTISNRRVFFSLEKHNIPGAPDGMTIDTDGNLWVAILGGARILKIDGKKTETLLDTIQMPALQTTSVAFGGPNFDELYVTTGCFEYQGEKPSSANDGATYRVTGTGAKGYPASNFKLA